MKAFLQPVFVFLFLLFATLPLYILLPKIHFMPLPYNLFGILIIITGLVLNLSADRMQKKNQHVEEPAKIPNKPITTGVYRFMRHPMYDGMELILIGIVLFFNSLLLFLLPLLFFIYIFIVVIPSEERELKKVFSNEYSLYQEATKKKFFFQKPTPYDKKPK
ncbi:MAG: isoprenylcysteine carboxylmethyltransferase family protein [Caldisericia bacterium]|nr:isoprenylcysteine carboxylmethyltransferase family protein [Caldisericia bacterium]